MRKIILLLLVMGILPVALKAQIIRVSGVIRDENGTIAGATVSEKGVKRNVVGTDNNGRFIISLSGTAKVLVITSIGYTGREIQVKEDNEGRIPDIYLTTDNRGLDEVIVQGYTRKTAITNTGAVSTIQAAAVRNIPTANIQNTLQGRLPGFFSVQRSGQPGRDAADFYIRGVSSLNGEGNVPLIIVDDIEYSYSQLSQINVNEIETISILKDASSTAIYGIKGANGVLVVTTRRGQLGAPKVNLRVESGMQTPVQTPKFLNAYETAVLRNEALSNDNLRPDFTQEDLTLFQNGKDPYGHPDVNWYDVIFKSNSLQANTNIDISGGTEGVKYFISGGALTQNGAVRNFPSPKEEINNNFFFNRYNFRTNLDLKATKSLDLRLDLTGRFGEINEPFGNRGLLGEIYNYNRISPYASPVLNPNGSYSYNPNSLGENNLGTINSRIATQGYTRERSSDFNVFIEAKQKLDFITEGLSVNGRVAYASTTSVNRGLRRYGAPPAYRYNPITEGYTIKPGDIKYVLDPYVLFGGAGTDSRNTTLQGLLIYNRDFGKHNINGLGVFNQRQASNAANLPDNYRGYSLRVGYGYDKKYLVDFTNAYNGTDRFKKHYGYFPAASVAWNISEESFIKDNADFIDFFKLRGSYGIVGSDAVFGNKYLYIQQYNEGGSYAFGQTPVSGGGVKEGTLGNSSIVWEKQKSLDIGLELNMFKGKFAVEFGWFRNIRYDQLIQRNSVSNIIGVDLPRDNLGRVKNSGFDGRLSYRPTKGDLFMDFGLVFSYAKNKILYMDEPFPDYPYLTKTGKSLDQPFGYTWIGYYDSAEDVANSAKPLGTQDIQPGDLKYADLNKDGVIDNNDKAAIGRPNLPNLTLGLPMNFSYRGLSLNVLFQGSFNYSLGLSSNAIEPFQTQLQDIHQKRWTPQSVGEAQFPRLSTFNNTINSPSNYLSDFYLIDAQYVRLKTVEFKYQFPSKLLPFKINNIAVYLSGYNLVTWTNYSLYQQDPETSNGSGGDSYLNQRVFNLGVQIGF